VEAGFRTLGDGVEFVGIGLERKESVSGHPKKRGTYDGVIKFGFIRAPMAVEVTVVWSYDSNGFVRIPYVNRAGLHLDEGGAPVFDIDCFRACCWGSRPVGG